MFKICARTVLELGAELISSDIIAFYELIKNAFDADSENGAEIRFEIAIRRNDYLRLQQRIQSQSTDIDRLKSNIDDALDTSASNVSLGRFREIIDKAESYETLASALEHAFMEENRIIVSDSGDGMSLSDLVNNYLVIGTASRKRAVDAALLSTGKKAPFLGEKGIGRLSVMRLGEKLRVETAKASDSKTNLLEIDWSEFNDIDAMLDEISVEPSTGDNKPSKDWSGTTLIISSLTADWTYERVRIMGEDEFSRLTDPFRDSKKRPRIATYWNGKRVPVLSMDRNLLAHAHAKVIGKLTTSQNGPVLKCTFEARDLGFEHPHEIEKRSFSLPDLQGAISGTSGNIPMSAIEELGPFEFEAHWYNRQRLKSIDSIGEQKTVRDLQKRWSGILLFRDGFRILPYGEDDDDWLALDRRALGSTGYLLNKAQFVGRISISRIENPLLIDQTNREGLRVCPEQQTFVSILQFVIQSQLREFLVDLKRRHQSQPIDVADVKTDVARLEARAKTALLQIKRVAPESADTIEELQLAFFEIQEFFDQAQRRITEIEAENRQMLQMAGVGLLVEVVAHELARSTENALASLEALKGKDVPEQIAGLLESLRSEMKSVGKRIRVLDPLSVSGRQRKESFDLKLLVEDVLSGHELQFKRHGITVNVSAPDKPVRIKAVKGMIVQILENLVSNSVYWMDLRRGHEIDFEPAVSIIIGTNPLVVTYEDNGRGVATENKEKVFRAFYSLKEKTKRRGLGLYIARDCAEHHRGTLTLDETTRADTGRLHRFVLALPDEVLIS